MSENQAEGQVEMQVHDTGAHAAYANFARVTATPEEVIVDLHLDLTFGLILGHRLSLALKRKRNDPFARMAREPCQGILGPGPDKTLTVPSSPKKASLSPPGENDSPRGILERFSWGLLTPGTCSQ